jgi:hypothetical protein
MGLPQIPVIFKQKYSCWNWLLNNISRNVCKIPTVGFGSDELRKGM